MDFNNNTNNNNNNYNNYTPPVKVPGSGLATAAMVLGILAIVTAFMMTLYLPFLFGGLAILLALLSKGTAARLQSKATMGIICSIIGLTANIGIWAYSLSIVITNPDAMIQAARFYDDIIEATYGMPSEEILGDSMEDIITDMYEAFE